MDAVVLYPQVGTKEDAASAAGSLHAKASNIQDTLDAKLGDSADVRADNTLMGWLASPIKSVQRGTIVFGTSDTSKSAMISSVDVSKAMINFLGISHAYAVSTNYSGSGDQFNFGSIEARITLANATTVTATRGIQGVAITVSYEVIEYY